MAAIVKIFERVPFEMGLEEAEIQAGDTLHIAPVFAHWATIASMTIASVSRDLIIEQIDLDNQILAQNVPAAIYLGPSKEIESELILRLPACFRYQDHTLE